MGAFATAFTQVFTVITVLCAALASVAQSFLNLAKVGEEESASYLDKSRSDRLAALAAINAANGTDVKVEVKAIQ